MCEDHRFVVKPVMFSLVLLGFGKWDIMLVAWQQVMNHARIC